MKKILDALDDFLELGGLRKQIILLIISGISLLLGFFDFLPFDTSWIAIVLCGVPILLEALISLIERFDIKSGMLVSVALIASVAIGETFAAGEVAFIMQLGELLEHLTVKKARSGIEKLVRLTPKTCRLIVDGEERIVPPEEIKIGDTVRILPGETIAVDGIIIKGETSVDQSLMTGESIPVDKGIGDEVYSGTINRMGAFEMRVEKCVKDSFAQRMALLVESADAKKSKIVSITDRWATWIVVAALVSAVVAGVISADITRAVTVLVVFCPCALVLATPTAIMAAIGNASRQGCLVSKGDAFERLAKVDKVCFDKTGTLTYGEPEVVETVSLSKYSADEILRLCAGAEQFSEHPLGKSIVKHFKDKGVIPDATDFEVVLGRGVRAKCEEKTICAGNGTFMTECGIDVSEAEKNISVSNAVIFVCIDKVLAGYISFADKIREDSQSTLEDLKKMDISANLLTGDKKEIADRLVSNLDICEICAECLPEEKLAYIEKSRDAGFGVLMVGDGINDAAALKCADVGIAMGKVGSDITLDAADIVLVNDDISKIPYLLKLSKTTLKKIKLNIMFSMGLNFAAVILAATGYLNPIVGALVHNAGSVAVVLNSSLLLRWHE